MNNTTEYTEILRVKYKNTYDVGRKNALISIIVTFFSIALLAFAGIYFYFSAYLPVTLAASGAESYYLDTLNPTDEELIAEGIAKEDIAEYRADLAEYQANTDGMLDLVVGVGLALIITLFYLVCWLLSKKHPVWMIVLTVFYVLDSLLVLMDLPMYLGSDVKTAVFLVLFHAWILYYLISAVIAGNKLKKLPAPIEGVAVEVDPTAESAPAEAVPTEETVPAEVAAPADTDNTPEV